MKKLILTAAIVIAATGCATQKDWTATGGSRADGTIQLSYTYGPFERPVTDSIQGLAIAKDRCEAWGYASAEAFGGIIETCTRPSGIACDRFMVTTSYQCLTEAANSSDDYMPRK